MLEVCYSISFHFLPLGRKIENTSSRRNFLHGPRGSQVTLRAQLAACFHVYQLIAAEAARTFFKISEPKKGAFRAGGVLMLGTFKDCN